jgi:oligopeptide/dipeptide ABC transporter ATP-binding protein
MSEPLLRVSDLRTYFRTDAGVARAVDGVSFHVDEGETLGIVGESGSGKSVTSLSVMRLIPEPPGRIEPGSSIRFRDGEEEVELAQMPEDRMRRIRGNDIAMIFQEPMTSLNPVFRVGDQIMESLRLHQGLSKDEARQRAIEMLRLVGIPIPEKRVDEYPHQLSGGMRQRVMIAIALACDPKLLIADEPTTALDVTIQAQILELLNQLQTELGMSIILITHDLGVVAETCDRVIVMYAGQVFEEGEVADVFHDPQNPYTEGLLRSIPKLGSKEERLAVIPGVVPSPTAWPTGCRFRARCPYGWEKCEREEPPEFEIAPGRRNKCWLVEFPERREEIRRTTGGFTAQGALTGTGSATPTAGPPTPPPPSGEGGLD